MIPKVIREFQMFIVGFSGGKDSLSVLLWALENLPRERVRVMYNPVGPVMEPPENQDYLSYIEQRLDVSIEIIKAGDRPLPPPRGKEKRQPWELATSLIEMIELRGMWPDWNNRYCTTYMKQWPTALWARELSKPVLLSGQRREESKRRATLPFFSGKKNWKQTRDGLPIYRPILEWSIADVWQMIANYGLAPNPVYERSSRCNCTLCFQARRCEILNFCRMYPNIAQQAVDLERRIGHLWKSDQSIAGLLEQARQQLALFPACVVGANSELAL